MTTRPPPPANWAAVLSAGKQAGRSAAAAEVARAVGQYLDLGCDERSPERLHPAAAALPKLRVLAELPAAPDHAALVTAAQAALAAAVAYVLERGDTAQQTAGAGAARKHAFAAGFAGRSVLHLAPLVAPLLLHLESAAWRSKPAAEYCAALSNLFWKCPACAAAAVARRGAGALIASHLPLEDAAAALLHVLGHGALPGLASFRAEAECIALAACIAPDTAGSIWRADPSRSEMGQMVGNGASNKLTRLGCKLVAALLAAGSPQQVLPRTTMPVLAAVVETGHGKKNKDTLVAAMAALSGLAGMFPDWWANGGAGLLEEIARHAMTAGKGGAKAAGQQEAAVRLLSAVWRGGGGGSGTVTGLRSSEPLLAALAAAIRKLADAAAPLSAGDPPPVHAGVGCDRCGKEVVGIRYKARGRNYDLCHACSTASTVDTVTVGAGEFVAVERPLPPPESRSLAIAAAVLAKSLLASGGGAAAGGGGGGVAVLAAGLAEFIGAVHGKDRGWQGGGRRAGPLGWVFESSQELMREADGLLPPLPAAGSAPAAAEGSPGPSSKRQRCE
eukprot:SAG22_NODE_1266_length_4956_cov_3.272184_3_plen_560_part_00